MRLRTGTGPRRRGIGSLLYRLESQREATDTSRWTLGEAAGRGHLAAVERLLAAGADPNQPGRDGRRPLHRAVAVAATPLVERLLAAGADAGLLDDGGQTPLALARVLFHHEVAAVLAEAVGEPVGEWCHLLGRGGPFAPGELVLRDDVCLEPEQSVAVHACSRCGQLFVTYTVEIWDDAWTFLAPITAAEREVVLAAPELAGELCVGRRRLVLPPPDQLPGPVWRAGPEAVLTMGPRRW